MDDLQPSTIKGIDGVEWSKVHGALMGAALADALSEPTPGCIQEFTQSGQRVVQGFQSTGSITPTIQLLLFAVAACLEGSMEAASNGSRPSSASLVSTGYKRWLHVRGLPWMHIDLHHDQRYNCWLMEEAVLYRDRAFFGYGIGGGTSFEGMFGPTPDLAGALSSSVGPQIVAPAALAFVDLGDMRDSALFDEASEISELTEDDDAQAAGLLALLMRRLLTGGDLDSSLIELSNEVDDEAATIIDWALAPSDGFASNEESWLYSESSDLLLALRAAREDGTFESTLTKVINASGPGSTAGVLYGMIAGAVKGYEELDPDWVENLECAHVINELAADVSRWNDLLGELNDPIRFDWHADDFWTKYILKSYVPGASQLWEIDLSVVGQPSLVPWNQPGLPRRGLEYPWGDSTLSVDAIGIVDLPMGDGLVVDEGVRIFRDERERLYLYVSPFGPHPGLDHVKETLVAGKVGASLVGTSQCGDARSFLAWAMESSDAGRAFGGLSTLARMGTVLQVNGGFEDSMQDDLGFLGLRADGRRGWWG